MLIRFHAVLVVALVVVLAVVDMRCQIIIFDQDYQIIVQAFLKYGYSAALC